MNRNYVTGVTGITHPYPDGQKLDRIALEYESCLDPDSISREAFLVQGRAPEKAYVRGGRSVILELDAKSAAKEVAEDFSTGKKPEPGAPFSPALSMPLLYYKRPEAAVIQKLPIRLSDGTEIPPDGRQHPLTCVREETVSEFISRQGRGLVYDLFIPGKLEKSRTYPLVVFIQDASPNGTDPLLPLVQGFGATGFAVPQIQDETPCFVLTPQIPSRIPFVSDDFTCSPLLENVFDLIRDIAGSYPIDPDRILLTGQSQGCMASCELNVRHPDFFAASLLVAGQWNPETMGKNCSGKKLWIVVSDGDEKACPGMSAVIRALQENGALVEQAELDAKAPLEEQNQAIERQAADAAGIHFTVFKNHSVVPEGMEDSGGSNHVSTWPAAYRLVSLRRWLVSQKRY